MKLETLHRPFFSAQVIGIVFSFILPLEKKIRVRKRVHLWVLSLLLPFCLWSGYLSAQSQLSTSTVPTRINYENGTEFTDYIIPNVGGRISFTLNGGDGGRRRVPNLCTRKGGKGATIQSSFFIGPGSEQLASGGRLRFIPGERGESRGGNGAYGSGGGGGSGLLYTTASDLSSLSQTPSLDLTDANTSWVLLAVAGGGGAGLNGVCDGNAGGGGNTLTNGLPGMPSGSNGGTDGDGGQVGGGGGYRVPGGWLVKCQIDLPLLRLLRGQRMEFRIMKP